ncbi:MAG: hypothetical protein ABI867_28945 [Kofleriaceae bacterium]
MATSIDHLTGTSPRVLGEAEKAALAPVLVELCVEDRWLAMTVACFASGVDVPRCRGSLSVDQRGRFAAAVMKARVASGSATR